MVLDFTTAVVALATVAVLMVLLRWAYGNERPRRRTSLVERRPRPGHSDEYGLLVAISAPGSYIEGEMARRRLEEAGIRVTLATTTDGPRVMVFPEDEDAARRLLAG